MSKPLLAVVMIMLAMAVLTGCNAGSLFHAKAPADPALGEQQLERDPVPLLHKPEHGIHYDPRNWMANAYQPDTIAAQLTASGERGVQQMSFAGTGGDVQVAVDRTGTWMAYSTTRYSKTPQICIQRIDSKAVTQITTDHMSDMMPAFSADSERIAWASNRYGNWDILVKNLNGSSDSDITQLTRGTDDEIHPSWSPDDRLIAYSRFNSMDGKWQIWVMNLQTGATSNIGEGLFANFSPTMEERGGRRIYTLAYQRHRRRDIPWYSIWTTSFTMEANGQIASVASPVEIVADNRWAAINPAWSPDGNYIAFATVGKAALAQWQARIYKPDDIYVVRKDGTDLTQITRHSAPDWNPFWAIDPNNPSDPNGRIYFSSERSGVANIWSVRPVIAGMVARGDR